MLIGPFEAELGRCYHVEMQKKTKCLLTAFILLGVPFWSVWSLHATAHAQHFLTQMNGVAIPRLEISKAYNFAKSQRIFNLKTVLESSRMCASI